MREILFKAQSVDNGEWVFGLLEEDDHYNFYISFYDIDRAKNLIKIKPETLSQFTGLKDKNGKKIFEGDIVKDEDNIKETIIWDRIGYDSESGLTGFTFLDDSFFRKTQDFTDCLRNIDLKELEVIGNKFDNPELLEVGEC